MWSGFQLSQSFCTFLGISWCFSLRLFLHGRRRWQGYAVSFWVSLLGVLCFVLQFPFLSVLSSQSFFSACLVVDFPLSCRQMLAAESIGM
ncbi:hypothetical protein BC567DRAFT_13193 [Phyllosticta citribraziliensis]